MTDRSVYLSEFHDDKFFFKSLGKDYVVFDKESLDLSRKGDSISEMMNRRTIENEFVKMLTGKDTRKIIYLLYTSDPDMVVEAIRGAAEKLCNVDFHLMLESANCPYDRGLYKSISSR